MRPRRNPLFWTGLIARVIILGLGSRRFAASLPGVVAAYVGDTLRVGLGGLVETMWRMR